MPTRDWMTPARRASVAVCGAVLLSGCAGGGLSMSGSPTPYTASNAIMPIGFTEKPIDATHYEVKASGTEETPKERVEKIALARAAEIGVEQKLPYFKVAGVTHGVSCSKKLSVYKAGDSAATYHPTVVLDVYYSKQPQPEHRPSADTFKQVKAEIDADVTPPEVKAAAAAQARAACGAT
jgi:hypothetical protein